MHPKFDLTGVQTHDWTPDRDSTFHVPGTPILSSTSVTDAD